MLRPSRMSGVISALVLLASTVSAADKRPMTLEDMFAFKRVASPRISPDGKRVAYQVTTVSLQENKSTTAIRVADTDGVQPPKQLTSPMGKKDSHPRWSPDGKRIVFESNRSGSSQLWLVPSEGGEPKQLTDISTGASSPLWSPDGQHIAFVSTVFPEFSEKPFAESDKLNKAREEEIEKNPVKARVFTRLFFRHWDEYVEDKRQHLFVISADGKNCRDATPGDRDAHPTSSTFSSEEDFAFSPDSKFLVFTAVPESNESWSTNYDLCRVSIDNKSTKWETLTADNKAADGGPKFSSSGKKLAWRSQKKAGYEADKWDITVADCNPDGTLSGKPTLATAGVDLSVNDFSWNGAYDRAFFFTADRDGKTPIFMIHSDGQGFRQSYAGDVCGSLTVGENNFMCFTEAAFDHPIQVKGYWWPTKGEPRPMSLDHANDDLLAALDRPRPEAVKVKVEGGEMHMWILKPPGFDPAKKWPVVFLVHGGPQGAWEDTWSYRWNPLLWASQGYVVALPNPRGSTGFGQKFVDEISGDWGGKCYRDLVAGLDYVEKLPYIDRDRIGAAGGSFGGYMMNWFAVSEIAPRFKCLITHCSVWNFESMWGTTDELWFDEYEHGGLPWEIPGKYREFSPHVRAGNLGKYKTPMLVIHNDLDFRCPIGQGHELFSALQRQKVPSRFINFPDEGHWVLKPKNSYYWHKEVFGWLNKYVPPGGK